MWKVYYFDMNYIEKNSWEQAVFLMASFNDIYAPQDFKEFTHIC